MVPQRHSTAILPHHPRLDGRPSVAAHGLLHQNGRESEDKNAAAGE
jgi:hypothetical protein